MSTCPARLSCHVLENRRLSNIIFVLVSSVHEFQLSSYLTEAIQADVKTPTVNYLVMPMVIHTYGSGKPRDFPLDVRIFTLVCTYQNCQNTLFLFAQRVAIVS